MRRNTILIIAIALGIICSILFLFLYKGSNKEILSKTEEGTIFMSGNKSIAFYIDSVSEIIQSAKYSSDPFKINNLSYVTLDTKAFKPVFENELSTQIIDYTFPKATPYEIGSTLEYGPCEFNSIEREQFRSGTTLHNASVTRNDDNKIKLFGLVKGDFQKNSKAFILDYCAYLDTVCLESAIRKKIRLTAGLRIIYFVKDWGFKGSVDGLEKIAASKELNFSESSLEIQTIGWGQNDNAIDTLKTALQNITVKNYPAACSALINLLGAFKTARSLKPQVIPLQ